MSEDLRLTGLVGYSGMKIPVDACATSNITLTAEQTIDGVTTSGSRVLLTGQTDQKENGIWVSDSGAWSRASDCDGPYDLRTGSCVFVTAGTSNSGFWYCTTANTVDIGTDNITWERASNVLATFNAFWQTAFGASTASAAFAALAAEAMTAGGIISPTALAANTDNWAPTNFATSSMIRVSASAAYNLTGIAGGAAGRLIMLHNVGSFTVTLKNDVTSTAANRFLLSEDYELQANQSVTLEYDGTTSRWRIFGQRPSTIDNSINDFRLTLTSGTPVTTSDVTGAGTLYCAPYRGNRIALYTGSAWILRTSAQFSLALTLTSGRPYDVFCYDNNGTPTLETLIWTNDTTRATALTTQDGVLVKSGDATRRYIGTLYASGANTTEDSIAKRYLWNYYNRVPREMRVTESTASWNYTTATWRQARATASNQLDYVQGYSEDIIEAWIISSASNSTGNVVANHGIGVDSTSPSVTSNMAPATVPTNPTTLTAHYAGFPGVGRHTLPWCEYSAATGTTTFYGTAGGATSLSGIFGRIMA